MTHSMPLLNILEYDIFLYINYDFIKVIAMYVTDEIQEAYKNWKKGDIILIHAQTGTGKTYFILNVLLPYIASQKKQLLYLSNRSALRDQISLSYLENYTDSIIVKNYQSFELTNLNWRTFSELGSEILNCEYWVMDEAHYFLADGRFNSNVLSCIRSIKANHQNRILIFMTATPEYLLLSLGQIGLIDKKPPSFEFDTGGIYHKLTYNCTGKLEDSNLIFQLSALKNLMKYKEASDKSRRNYDDYLEALEKYNAYPEDLAYAEQLKYYMHYSNYISADTFQKKYCAYQDYFRSTEAEIISYRPACSRSSVRPIYFKNLNQLIQCICKTPREEKWLIFVSSTKKGEEIKASLLGEDKDISVVIITAKTKQQKTAKKGEQSVEYEAYQSIIQNEYSPERITISTAVLDNGVNLKDQSLKHIAIFEMNSTLFVQMLGRKRSSHYEPFSLYLHAKDLGEIKGYFQRSILQYVRFIAKLKFVNYAAETTKKAVDMHVIANLENFTREYMVNGSFKNPYYHYAQQVSREPSPKIGMRTYMCRFFQPNEIMTIQLAYDYYRILALLESYENTPEDEKGAKKETLWIEHQLSWLGLKYDSKCWIDYPRYVRAKKIINRILSKPNNSVLSKNEQKKLKRAVITMNSSSHPPMTVKIGKGSLSKINEALIELGYSQKIVSKNRSIKGVQRNYWTITDQHLE